MIRAVFDTNVLVSSMIRHGKPRDLWNAVLDGKIHLLVSEEILEELISVAGRPKIVKYLGKRDMGSFLKILLQKSELVNIEEGESLNIAEDPDDNMVLETAVVGGAGYIVSGDNHLISLGSFREVNYPRLKAWASCFNDRCSTTISAGVTSRRSAGRCESSNPFCRWLMAEL